MNIFLSDSTYLVSPLYTQVPKAPVTLHRFDFNYILKIPSTTCCTTKLPRRHHLRRTVYCRDTVGFTYEGATDNPHRRIQPLSRYWKEPPSHCRKRVTVAEYTQPPSHRQKRSAFLRFSIMGDAIHLSTLDTTVDTAVDIALDTLCSKNPSIFFLF